MLDENQKIISVKKSLFLNIIVSRRTDFSTGLPSPTTLIFISKYTEKRESASNKSVKLSEIRVFISGEEDETLYSYYIDVFVDDGICM